jgi:hypothetical protein
MAESVQQDRANNLAAGVLGAAVVVGLGVAAVAYNRQRASARPQRRGDKQDSLAAYLHEHLAGSDVAIQVLDRLRLVHAGTQEGRLFASLFDEFREERDVIRGLLDQIDESSLSGRRLAGGAAGGAALPFSPGAERGDLALFRTLEGLSIGVQGKRCMWRALQALLGDQPIPSTRSLAGLEAMAVRQWEAIEDRRRGLVLATFPAVRLSLDDVPID